jgi:hypothetical protein
MAKVKQYETAFKGNGKKKTSIGKSKRSRPTNKHKKRNHKKYRGQGSKRR